MNYIVSSSLAIYLLYLLQDALHLIKLSILCHMSVVLTQNVSTIRNALL